MSSIHRGFQLSGLVKPSSFTYNLQKALPVPAILPCFFDAGTLFVDELYWEITPASPDPQRCGRVFFYPQSEVCLVLLRGLQPGYLREWAGFHLASFGKPFEIQHTSIPPFIFWVVSSRLNKIPSYVLSFALGGHLVILLHVVLRRNHFLFCFSFPNILGWILCPAWMSRAWRAFGTMMRSWGNRPGSTGSFACTLCRKSGASQLGPMPQATLLRWFQPWSGCRAQRLGSSPTWSPFKLRWHPFLRRLAFRWMTNPSTRQLWRWSAS